MDPFPETLHFGNPQWGAVGCSSWTMEPSAEAREQKCDRAREAGISAGHPHSGPPSHEIFFLCSLRELARGREDVECRIKMARDRQGMR